MHKKHPNLETFNINNVQRNINVWQYMGEVLNRILFICFVLLYLPSQANTIEGILENHIDKLSNESILTTYRDSKGYLWVGTYMGLFRSDGTHYDFYAHDPKNKYSLSAPNVYAIYEDSDSNLWIGTQRGLNKYNYDTDNFTLHIPNSSVPDWTYIELRDIIEDQYGNIWLASYNHNGLIRYNAQTNSDTTFWLPNYGEHRLNALETHGDILFIGTELAGLYALNLKTHQMNNIVRVNKYTTPLTINDLHISDSILWIGTWGDGLLSYNLETENIIWHTPIDTDKAFKPLNNVRSIKTDKNKNIWLAIFEGGVQQMNIKTGEFNYLINKIDQRNDSKRYRSWCIDIDNDNMLWLGTFETGLKKMYLKSADNKYLKYIHKGNVSQINNITHAIYDNKKNNIWIATKTQGTFCYNTINNKATQTNLGNLNLGVIYLAQDSLNRIWASTNEGIYLINASTNKVICNLSHKNNYFRDVIKSPYFMYTDRDGDIWLSAWQTGLIRIPHNQLSAPVETYKPIKYMYDENNNNSILSNSPVNVYQTSDGETWVSGTYYFQKFDKQTEKFEWLAWYDASKITEDCNNNLWISSNSVGLTTYNRENNEFIILGKDYPGKTHGINVFNSGCSVWFPRKNDLIRINVASEQIDFFDNLSGIKKMNHSNSCFALENGDVFIGGDEGCYIYNPNNLAVQKNEILATHLLIYNNLVKVNDTVFNRVLLHERLENVEKLTIPAGIKSFSIEFSALNFVNPENAVYAYQLEGFDSTWNMLEYPNKTAVFNNLYGGNYTLKYALYKPLSDWKSEAKTIKIKVLIPYYKRVWFKSLMGLITVALIILFFIVRQYRLNILNIELENQVLQRTQELQQSNEELKTQTEQLNIANTNLIEKQEFINEQNEEIKQQKNELEKNNELLLEMNDTKDKFFSIIAHDLKSPIGSIMGLLDLVNEGYNTFSEDQTKEMIQESYNASQNVYKLVENLLYWARSISGKVEFKPQNTNLIQLINSNIRMLTLNIREKNIEISFNNSNDEILCNADIDMMNFVIRNILSNAIKFTHIDGKIKVQAEKTGNNILVSISDNGVGIAADKAEKIFRISNKVSTRGTNNEKGTGLGLVLCKDFIERHHGKIWIESEVNKGSTFYFSIPQSLQQRT